jgi:hypothetical protein
LFPAADPGLCPTATTHWRSHYLILLLSLHWPLPFTSSDLVPGPHIPTAHHLMGRCLTQASSCAPSSEGCTTSPNHTTVLLCASIHVASHSVPSPSHLSLLTSHQSYLVSNFSATLPSFLHLLSFPWGSALRHCLHQWLQLIDVYPLAVGSAAWTMLFQVDKVSNPC